MQEKSRYMKDIEERQLIRYLPEVNMTDRDKEIIDRYLNGSTTYKALAEEYGISTERIRQILIKFWRRASGLYNKEMRNKHEDN